MDFNERITFFNIVIFFHRFILIKNYVNKTENCFLSLHLSNTQT